MSKLVAFSILILYFATYANGLECYVCNQQEDNEGKCVRTVELCGRDDDWCLSLIKWGSMPYWTHGAPKQYFISKQCATKQDCDDAKRKTLPRCERIGYNDWECSECCQGDRCNYYITLGSGTIRGSWIFTALGSALVALVWLRN